MCQAADALRRAEAARAPSGSASVSPPRKAATAHYGRRSPRHVDDRDRLVLLGTGGGSAPKSTRAGYANAVVVGADAYLVDCGARVTDQALQAGISVNRRRTPRGGATIRSICLTHLHSDHVIDLVNILLSFWPDETVRLFGPGPAGLPIPTFPPDRVAPVIHPDDPTPGTAALLDHLFAAFAYNINLRMADEGRLNPVEKVDVSEIGVARDGFEPAVDLGVEASGESPDTTAPTMEPVVIQPEDDNGVTISTILVQHAPVFPALAFRFDTPSGSVVFSGDTGPCANLARLARGADILVHEAMDIEGVGRRVAHLPNRDELIAHMAKAHTAPEEAGRVAEEAGVGALVLSHLVPGDDEVPEPVWEERARENFDGPVLCAVDLDEFALTDALR